MATENFTTYTEVDPNSRITVTTTKVTWTLVSRDEDAYVYKDKGAGYFSGDFTCLLTYRSTGGAGGGTAHLGIWSLTNLVDDLRGINNANGDYLALFANPALNLLPRLTLREGDGGTLYSSSNSITLAADTDYYLKIVRDESVGTYGTLYCYIYDDSGRTNLIDTISVALHSSKKDFRYIYALHSLNTGEASVTDSGYTKDLHITVGETSTYESFPSDSITRVTSLTHRYDRGTYTLELNLGEVVADFGLPEWDSKPKKAIPTEEPPPPSIISPPVTPVTETGLPGVTMPFTTRMPTAAEMAERAGMAKAEYDKIIQQGKVTKALEEFGPLTGPADLTKFKARYPELGIGVGAPKIGDPDYMARMGLLGAAAKAEADIKAATTTGPSLPNLLGG